MLRHHRVVLLALVLFGLLPSLGKAGQGGYITLVNGTPYNWRSSDLSGSQMNSWSFPEVITAGSTATLYVEWSDSTPVKKDGVVTFSLEGTGEKTDPTFQLEATAASGAFDLRVTLTDFSTLGNPQGSIIDLGWNPNGYIHFILAGEAGSFTSNRMPDAWMHENLGVLGNRSLRNLCIPGSHDAGMSTLTAGTPFAKPCNTVTQTRSVLDQLHAGARYFDIRPVLSGGQLYTGHFSPVPTLGVQGATGQSLDSIIDDVNAYTADNQELIVLYLSHDLKTDLGIFPLTQTDWNFLLTKLLRLNHRFVAPNPTTVDLTTLPLRDFIGSQAAVVVVAQPSNGTITLGDFVNQGFYKPQSFPVVDEYANTESLDTMQTDQLIKKLPVHRPAPDAGSFLLSWTLTQSVASALRCPAAVPPGTVSPTSYPSVLDLAAKAAPALYQNVLPVSNRRTFPNILDIDNVQSSDIAALAMAVNSKISWDTPQEYVIYKGLGSDTGIYVAHSSDGDLTVENAWSWTRMNPAIQTSATPGAVAFAGGLYVFYKGPGTDSRIFVAQPAGGNILEGGAWHAEPMGARGDRTFTIQTSAAPGLAVFDNKLYMFFKKADSDAVYIAQSKENPGDGKSWSAHLLDRITTSTAPAVATFKGGLYMFYKGADSKVYIARSTGEVFDGSTWNASPLNLDTTSTSTNEAPGAVVYNGDLYVFYKGGNNDTSVYIARSSDGSTWSAARLNLGINTFTAPKPVVVGNSLYLVYTGTGDNYIWIATPLGGASPLDGDAWRAYRLNPATIHTSTGPGAAVL